VIFKTNEGGRGGMIIPSCKLLVFLCMVCIAQQVTYSPAGILMLKYNKNVDAARCGGVGRFTGLPLWTCWDGKTGHPYRLSQIRMIDSLSYLPLILPLESGVGFCLLLGIVVGTHVV
jgi:hypothetical protein